MSEIKVGEYVRYKSGVLRKVSRIIPIYENDKLLKDKYYIEFDGKGDIGTYRSEQVKEFITKHSPNIKKLIEYGDYINGEKVVNVSGYDKDGNDKDELGIIDVDDDYAYGVFLEDITIKSIVTHEQFAQMEYKVEE